MNVTQGTVMESGFVFFLIMFETICIVCRTWAGGREWWNLKPVKTESLRKLRA